MATVVRSQKTIKKIFRYYITSVKRDLEEIISAHQNEIAKIELQLEETTTPSREKIMLEYKEEILHLLKMKAIQCYHDAANGLAKARNYYIAEETRNFKFFDEVAQSIRQNFFVKCHTLSTSAAFLSGVYGIRSGIAELVRNNQVSVIISEIGSCHRTQLMQLLYEAGLADSGVIVCTQPQAVAAISLATQMAKEKGNHFEPLVAFRVKPNLQLKETVKLLYVTEEVLLEEYVQDPNLSTYSCVIIDEAHSRSICTDILREIIKKCLATRPDLRVVVMSSNTIPEVFLTHSRQLPIPVSCMSDSMLPMKVEWREPGLGTDLFANYQEDAVRKAVEVHQSEMEGGILVFVTSPLEAAVCCRRFQDAMKGRSENFLTLQLHEFATREEVQNILCPAPEGVRKIVFATDCVETSVNVPGIRYVIDTGLKKELTLNSDCCVSSLALTLVSQESAKWRQACAGQSSTAKCFRLYTENNYAKMNVDSAPEVLRADMSYVVLKLMEFDVDPMTFDSILAPSFYALKEALLELENIGAVSEGKITDLGKWIAKLPFNPKYGALIHEALQVGIGLEAIIVAAASGTGLTLYMKEKRDNLNSLEHESGDQLTVVSVFREWYSLPENEKQDWCASRSIDTRLLKVILEVTKDALYLLGQKLGVHIGFSFCNPETADRLLIQLLFRAFSENVCHVFQHFATYYCVLFKDTVVSIHPSSVVLSRDGAPEWIVFEGFSRSSGNFAVKVTVIPEDLVSKGISDGWLKLDMDEVKANCTVEAHCNHLEAHLEEEFHKQNVDSLKSVEAEFEPEFLEVGTTFNLFHTVGRFQLEDSLMDSLSRCTVSLKRKFELEDSEECLGSRQHLGMCVRAIVGAGGNVENILMPDEFRVSEVKCKAGAVNTWTEEEVSQKFSQIGNSDDCRKCCQSENVPAMWEQVTFEHPESPMEAVARTEHVPDLAADPNCYVHLPLRIQCCRRPSRGFGVIKFKHQEARLRAIRRRQFLVAGSRVRIKQCRYGKSGNFVKISGLGLHAAEHLVRDAVIESLHLCPEDIKKVMVARRKVQLKKETSKRFKYYLTNLIEKYTQSNDYYIEVEEPQSEDDIYFVAHCVFNNPKEGHLARREINNGLHFFRGNFISVNEGLHNSILTDEAVYREKREAIKKVVDAFAMEGLHISLNKNGKIVTLNLYSEDTIDACAKLSAARRALQKIVRGDIIKVENQPAARSLFSEKGRNVLRTVVDKTDAVVLTDDRLKVVSLHGSPRKRKAALAMINQNLEELDEEVLEIRVGEKVIETLKCSYGNDLGDLSNVSAAKLVHQRSGLKVSGSEIAVNKVYGVVDEIRSKLLVDEGMTLRNACIQCFSPVNVKDLWRLICCGHTYCKECMQMKINQVVDTGNFPITCGGPCHSKLAWKDLLKLNYKDNISLSRLVTSSVRSFVSQHKHEFQYCPTPYCPSVYRTSENGTPFLCPECNLIICTHCRVPHHHGLTCTQYKGTKDRTPEFRNERMKLKVEYKRRRNMEKVMARPSKVLSTGMKDSVKNSSRRKKRSWQRELRTLINRELQHPMAMQKNPPEKSLVVLKNSEPEETHHREMQETQVQKEPTKKKKKGKKTCQEQEAQTGIQKQPPKQKKKKKDKKVQQETLGMMTCQVQGAQAGIQEQPPKKKGKKLQEENVRKTANQEMQEQIDVQRQHPPKTAKKEKRKSTQQKQGQTTVQKQPTKTQDRHLSSYIGGTRTLACWFHHSENYVRMNNKTTVPVTRVQSHRTRTAKRRPIWKMYDRVGPYSSWSRYHL